MERPFDMLLGMAKRVDKSTWISVGSALRRAKLPGLATERDGNTASETCSSAGRAEFAGGEESREQRKSGPADEREGDRPGLPDRARGGARQAMEFRYASGHGPCRLSREPGIERPTLGARLGHHESSPYVRAYRSSISSGLGKA